jgi:probable biosynthetic protein (TIGR04098 family)
MTTGTNARRTSMSCPIEDAFEAADANSVYRRVTVKPAMSGHNSLFVGQIGDWTWDTVTALCGTNVFNATNASGAPTYLAFYYFHLRGSPALHSASLTFGDRLEVVSTPFNFGSESILTLHRIEREGQREIAAEPIDPQEFYDNPRNDCLYVETFNRWITRSQKESNQGLIRSSPVDFKYDHLNSLPDRYSPRLACGQARINNTFHDTQSPEYVCVVDDFHTEYRVDITRDINAVGLVYFASYFSIVDGALLKLWKHLGRTSHSFLSRVVLDHKLCYLSNADLDSLLRITLKSWRKAGHENQEVYNTVIQDCETMRVIAVSTMHVLTEATI